MVIGEVMTALVGHPMLRVRVNRYKDGYLSTVFEAGNKGLSDFPFDLAMHDVTGITASENILILEYNDD